MWPFSLVDINILFSLLLIAGVTAILFEVFIPSFGAIGITGAVFIYIALGLISDLTDPLNNILISFIIAVLISFILIRLILKTKKVDDLVLDKSIESLASQEKQPDNTIGVVMSNLRPVGKIKVAGKVYEAQSCEEFIEKGAKIEIIEVKGNKIYCRRID